MALPALTITRPSNIQGLDASQIGASHLEARYFPGVGYGSLNPKAALAWDALVVACLAETGETKTAYPVYSYVNEPTMPPNEVMNQIDNVNWARFVERFITRLPSEKLHAFYSSFHGAVAFMPHGRLKLTDKPFSEGTPGPWILARINDYGLGDFFSIAKAIEEAWLTA